MLSDNQGSGPGQVAADTEARVRSVGRLLRENKFCEARRLLEDELASLGQNHPKALFFLACMQGIGLGGRIDISSARQLLVSLIDKVRAPARDHVEMAELRAARDLRECQAEGKEVKLSGAEKLSGADVGPSSSYVHRLDGGGGGGDGEMSHGQTRSWLEEYAQHEYVLGCVLWYDEDGFIRIE